MSDVGDWDINAGANNDPAPNGFPEGMPPSGVNDASREVMAAIKRFYEQIGTVRDVMGVPTYELDVIAPDAITADTIAVNSIAPNKLIQSVGGRLVGTIVPDNNGLKDSQFLTPSEAKAGLAIGAGDVSGLGALATAGSVGESTIDANSVHTSELATGADDGNLSFGFPQTNNDTQIMTGGRYSFYPQVSYTSHSGTFDPQWYISRNDGGTFAISTRISLGGGSGFEGGAGSWRNYYVDSSAPWSLGHGDIPLFIWLRENKDGKITGASVSEAPTWGYNGETDLTADRVSKVLSEDGTEYFIKKYKNVVNPDSEIIVPPWRGGDASKWNPEAYSNPEMVEVQIDQAMKNKDMDVLPHPFCSLVEGDRVVLVDPCSPIVDSLTELRKGGDKIGELFMDGYLELTSEVHCDIVPNGVTIMGARWK